MCVKKTFSDIKKECRISYIKKLFLRYQELDYLISQIRILNIKQCFFLMNKRPMGHIAHLRKQFKSINTYDNHNVDNEEKELFT